MNALLLAVSIVFTALLSPIHAAHAEDAINVARNVAANFTETLSAEAFAAGYTCSTRSRGVTYTSNDRDYRTAERNAITTCIQRGGDRLECQQNVYCVERGDSGRPPRDPYPPRGSYFDWGTGRNGYGYCYEWTWDGYVLNGGQPVPNFHCEAVRRSYYSWGRSRNGQTYCYQYTPYGVTMNEGQPVHNSYCR